MTEEPRSIEGIVAETVVRFADNYILAANHFERYKTDRELRKTLTGFVEGGYIQQNDIPGYLRAYETMKLNTRQD